MANIAFSCSSTHRIKVIGCDADMPDIGCTLTGYIMTPQKLTRIEKPLVLTDQNGFVNVANKAFCDISGCNREELIDQQFKLIHELSNFPDIMRHLNDKGAWVGHINMKDSAGLEKRFELCVTSIINRECHATEYVYIFQ